MPTVPKYQTGQVTSRGINARQNINISDDAFGGNIARAQINQGKVISQLGDTMFDHALKIRDERDKGLMREMDNNYSTHIREQWSEFSQLQGRSAMDARQPYLDSISEYRKKIAKDLDSRLTNSWNSMADARTNSYMNNITQHTTNQTIAYNKEQRTARIANQVSEMAAYPYDLVTGKINDAAIKKAKLVGITEINDELKDKGIDVYNPRDDGERAIINQAHLAFTTNGHTQVIENLLAADQATLADDYYKANKAEIDSQNYNILENLLSNQTALKRAQRQTDIIMSDSELAGDFDAQLETARDIKDPTLRKETVALVKIRQAEIKTLRTNSEDEAYDQAQKHLVAGGNKANMPAGVWEAMSGSQQRTLQSVLDTRVSNALKPGNPIKAKKEFFRLQNMAHNNYPEFKKENLGMYIGVIQETDLDNLMELQKSHTAVESSLSRKEQMEMVLGSLGKDLANFDKSGDSGDAIRSFVRKVDAKVAKFVESNNRKPDDQEYQGILLDIRNNEAYVEGWGPDSKMPVDLMTEDQKSNAYVIVDGENINLSEIPDLDRTQIIAQIKQRKGKVTAQNIAEVYVAQSNIKKQANLKKAKNIKSSIISMEQAETLADEAENKFGAVDIGWGDGDIEDIDKLNALSAEHLEALLLTESWSAKDQSIIEQALELKLNTRSEAKTTRENEVIELSRLKEELKFIDQYLASDMHTFDEGAPELIYEGSNISDAAMDADINNYNPNADLDGFETRDNFYLKRKEEVLNRILEIQDNQ